MELKRVVVTGLGAVTPLGKTVNEFWEGLVNGVSGANLITRFNPDKFKTKFACEVKDFNPENYFDRKEARKIDLYAMYALVAADESIRDSGVDLEKVDKDRVGVIFGSGIGGFGTVYSELIEFAQGEGTPRFNPFFIPKLISDIAAGRISIRYGFRGPNFATVSACATSTNAIVDAFNYIRLGKAEMFVTGGSEASIVEPGIGGFNAMQALSTRNDEYKTASRPFDKTRDGFVMGEGSGALVLEELEHARRRGARIYCEMAGYGNTADANHVTAPSPDGEGAARCMRMALRNASLNPDAISYINAHGTSTPQGDIAETRAIKTVFGGHARKLAVSSTKGATGHMLGAAGAVEMVVCSKAIQTGTVPPTINYQVPDPDCDLDYVPNTARQMPVNAVLNNSFGFGGHNASILARKFVG